MKYRIQYKKGGFGQPITALFESSATEEDLVREALVAASWVPDEEAEDEIDSIVDYDCPIDWTFPGNMDHWHFQLSEVLGPQNAREQVHPEIDIEKSGICLDYILHGEPKPEEVAAFFARGEFHEEYYQIAAIEKYLLTEDQRKKMFDANLTIEKMLNGRYTNINKNEELVRGIYDEWNTKLGFKCFG